MRQDRFFKMVFKSIREFGSFKAEWTLQLQSESEKDYATRLEATREESELQESGTGIQNGGWEVKLGTLHQQSLECPRSPLLPLGLCARVFIFKKHLLILLGKTEVESQRERKRSSTC